MAEIYIDNGGYLQQPVVQSGIEWTTERKDSPGILKFSVVKDAKADFTEGNPIMLKHKGSDLFYGFIFTKKRDKNGIIEVTAYDQIRYLKNKDTYVYEEKTAAEVLQMVCGDYGLNPGEIEDTGYKIPSRVEDNTTLMDMVQTALDITLENRKEMFVLYDDFGKLCLKNIENMQVNILINSSSAEDFSYTSTIDSQTYNRIKLGYDNEDTGFRDIYIAQDSENINNWGMLQYFDTLEEGENGKAKADALLELYNHKTRNLTVKNVFGDVRIRAGCLVGVSLSLGDMDVNSFLLVEKCKHTFEAGRHGMDLTLRGGEFVG